MILEKIVESCMGENTYVVGDEKTKKCIVIDPGANFVDIMSVVKKNNLNVEYVVLTHGHGDHITNVLMVFKGFCGTKQTNDKNSHYIKFTHIGLRSIVNI